MLAGHGALAWLSDLLHVQATDLARQMVTKYGMSDLLGQVSIDYEDNGRSLSSETRHVVEAEVCLHCMHVATLLICSIPVIAVILPGI